MNGIISSIKYTMDASFFRLLTRKQASRVERFGVVLKKEMCRSLQPTVLPNITDDLLGRVQREQVFVLPFDKIPGPRLPRWLASHWVVGPIQQVHCSTPNWLKPYEALFNRFGPLVRLDGDTLLASHPRHIEKILSASRPNRSALSTMEAKRKHTMPVRMPEYETDFSELSAKYSSKFDFKPNHFNAILEETSKKLISRMYYFRNLQYEVPSFNNELFKWGLQSIFQCLFSKDFGFLEDATKPIDEESTSSGAAQILGIFKGASHCLAETEAGPLGRFFMQRTFEDHIDVLHGVLCRHLRIKYLSLIRDPPPKLDLVEEMVLKEKMSANDILTRILDIIILGVNVVANSVGFIIYHLSKYPGCQGKLFDEVSTFHLSNVQELPYLNCCIAESMRLRPPFPYLSRELDDDVIIHGYGVPRGTKAYMINEVANMRKELFPRPKEFSPERWELKSGRPLSYEYHLLPMAPVASLLHAQIAILTGKLIEHFKFEYHYGKIDSSGRILATPNKSFRFTFIDRKPL